MIHVGDSHISHVKKTLQLRLALDQSKDHFREMLRLRLCARIIHHACCMLDLIAR